MPWTRAGCLRYFCQPVIVEMALFLYGICFLNEINVPFRGSDLYFHMGKPFGVKLSDQTKTLLNKKRKIPYGQLYIHYLSNKTGNLKFSNIKY